MDEGKPVIAVTHVNRAFGDKTVLKDITLQVNQAETFGILGPSGSGKTTLVKLLTGIDEVTSGEVTVLGVRMPKLAMLQQIGYMAQSDALYTELSAKENLEFFAALYGLKGGNRTRRIGDVMEPGESAGASAEAGGPIFRRHEAPAVPGDCPAARAAAAAAG